MCRYKFHDMYKCIDIPMLALPWVLTLFTPLHQRIHEGQFSLQTSKMPASVGGERLAPIGS